MEHTEISLLLDRPINADLLLWSICPTQDIIACCFADQIACHRLHWQRLWVYQHKNRNASPTAIVWHPEAKLLGVGLDDGTIILLDPETGSLNREVKVVESAITSLSWLEEEKGSAGSEALGQALRTGAGVPKPLTVLLAGDRNGNVILLTSALSTLAQFNINQLSGSAVPHGARPPVRILQAAAARSLRYLYVLWEASPKWNPGTTGCFLTVLDISVFSRTRLEVRTVSTTLECAADLVQKCQALVHTAESKWSGAVEVIRGMRSRLQSLMNDCMTEKQTDPNADIDQLERLLILGQSACPENVLHQFLSATLGEMGIKRTAKQVDSMLGSIAADILPELQTMVAPLMALSASLHSILLSELYFDSLSLQASQVQEMREACGTLLLLCEVAHLLIADLQRRWRQVFSWLLQTVRMMNSDLIGKNGTPIDTNNILRTLEMLRTGKLESNIFESLDLVSQDGPWLNLEHLSGKGRASLKEVLQNLQKLCHHSIHSLPSALSSKIQAVQHIPLPTLPERYPAASLLLSQNNKDPDSGTVTVCCPVGSPSAGALVVRLDPPDQNSLDSKHKVAKVQLKLGAGEILLDMVAMQMSGAWLTLLLASQQNTAPSALKLVPLSAVPLEQLPTAEAAFLQERREERERSVPVEDVEGTMSCLLTVGSYMPPLAVSGSRQVAAVVSGTRRICIYDLEDAG